MSNWLFKKLAPYAIKFREWSKGKIWIQIPLYILIFWMLACGEIYKYLKENKLLIIDKI